MTKEKEQKKEEKQQDPMEKLPKEAKAKLKKIKTKSILIYPKKIARSDYTTTSNEPNKLYEYKNLKGMIKKIKKYWRLLDLALGSYPTIK